MKVLILLLLFCGIARAETVENIFGSRAYNGRVNFGPISIATDVAVVKVEVDRANYTDIESSFTLRVEYSLDGGLTLGGGGVTGCSGGIQSYDDRGNLTDSPTSVEFFVPDLGNDQRVLNGFIFLNKATTFGFVRVRARQLNEISQVIDTP